MSKERKSQILNLIKSSKHILFGTFSSTLTKQDKANEWKKILKMCLALGLLKDDTKDYAYIRDTFWPNLKKATLAKMDNARKTGSGGGKEAILTEVDNLVLDIIGKESPSVLGLNQIDTMAFEEEVTATAASPSETEEKIDYPELPCDRAMESESRPKPIGSKLKSKRFITRDSPAHRQHEEEMKLKRRKLQLEVEHLELTNYKLRIDILKEEMELGLDRSKFTSSFFTNPE